jgi:3-isopropylmalate dehydrogenase
MMLEYLGYPGESKAIESAAVAAVDAGETTKDIGGSLGTRAAGDAVLKHLKETT